MLDQKRKEKRMLHTEKNVRPDLRVDMFLFLWGNIHPFFTLNFSQ